MKNIDMTFAELTEIFKEDFAEALMRAKHEGYLEGYSDGKRLGRIEGISKGMEIVIGKQKGYGA